MTPPDPFDHAAAEAEERVRAARFEPRASLGPEIAGRVRRDERPRDRVSRSGRWGAAAAAAVLLAVGLAVLGRGAEIDHCCFDLDGGGDRDDGVWVIAGPRESVRELVIYEDRDGSGRLSGSDAIRFRRGAEPTVEGPVSSDLVTTEHCCLDHDGGGRDDDAVLVIGRPPDRIVMAAIYDRSRQLGRPADRPRWRLR